MLGAEFEKCLDWENSGLAFYRAGICLHILKRFPEAVGSLHTARMANMRTGNSVFACEVEAQLGFTLVMSKRSEEGIRILEDVVGRLRECHHYALAASYVRYLAQGYANMNEHQKAIRVLQDAARDVEESDPVETGSSARLSPSQKKGTTRPSKRKHCGR